MTEKEMAMEIGDLILKYQIRINALKVQIKTFIDQNGNPATPWNVESKDEFDSEPFSGLFYDRSTQLRASLDEATPDVPLIHVLHQNLVARQK